MARCSAGIRLEAERDLRARLGSRAGCPWPDTRREGGSGVRPRGPEQSVEEGMRRGRLVKADGRGGACGGGCWLICRDQLRRGAHLVGDQVLGRLARIIQVKRSILVVVVTFCVPVQVRVLPIGQCIHRRTLTAQRHRLPEHGKQHGNEGGSTAHGARSLHKRLPIVPARGFGGASRRTCADAQRLLEIRISLYRALQAEQLLAGARERLGLDRLRFESIGTVIRPSRSLAARVWLLGCARTRFDSETRPVPCYHCAYVR